jgi:hypothetical protein
VGIGTTILHQSAQLELKSTTKGFLVPRMTTLQKHNIQNPAEGLMVYSVNSCGNGAMSIYSNNSWTNIPSCSDTDFDDDGIPDSLDIDDDNDGILDILEVSAVKENLINPNGDYSDGWNDNNPDSGVLTGLAYNTTPSGVTGSISYSLVRGFEANSGNVARIKMFNYGAATNSNTSQTGHGVVDINIPSPGESSDNLSTVSANPLILLDVDGDLEADLNIETSQGIVTDINKIQAAITNNLGSISVTDAGAGLFKIVMTPMPDPLDPNTGPDIRIDVIGESVTRYRLEFTSYNKIDVINFPVSRDLLTDLDPDGDGVPNRFDLDSDNDGCSDARESGSTTDATINFNYSNTDVGSNGFSNTIETSDLQSAVNISLIDTTNAYNSGVVCP